MGPPSGEGVEGRHHVRQLGVEEAGFILSVWRAASRGKGRSLSKAGPPAEGESTKTVKTPILS